MLHSFSVQNVAFDIANAGKENTTFIIVIGAVEYKMEIVSASRLQLHNRFRVS